MIHCAQGAGHMGMICDGIQNTMYEKTFRLLEDVMDAWQKIIQAMEPHCHWKASPNLAAWADVAKVSFPSYYRFTLLSHRSNNT